MESSVIDWIVELVEERSFIKGVELVTEITQRVCKSRTQDISSVDVIGVINTLVENGRINELEYVRDDAEYRIKSLYYAVNIRLYHESENG